jgi:hypothetical protein
MFVLLIHTVHSIAQQTNHSVPWMPPLPSDKKFDWEAAKRCLAKIHKHAPQILEQAVIIGGMGCWFYRQLLAKSNDPEFKAPHFSAADELLWLSKDIDFTNFFIADARELLKSFVVAAVSGPPRIEVAGLPVGFAQVGITLDPEVAWLDSWIGSFNTQDGTVEFRVLDPVSLYREKQALTQKRGSASDQAHHALMAEYLRFELCMQIRALKEATGLDEKSAPLRYIASIRDRAPEIAQDERLIRRLKNELVSQTFTASERKLISELFP